MKRRNFIRRSSQAALATPIILSSPRFLTKRAPSSPLISVTDKAASRLTFGPGKVPNNDRVIVDMIQSFSVDRIRVSNMMDTAVMKLTGHASVGKAWESLFPAGKLNQQTRISIKINLSYGEAVEENNWTSTLCPFGPKIALSDAIVHGLTQMLDGHFPAENITIFDTIYSAGSRREYPLVQGYRPVTGNKGQFYKDRKQGTYGIHWVNPVNKQEIPEDAPSFTAAPEYPKGYEAHQRIKPPVYQNDFMINVAIAKDHREAGVTGVMKNNYGCTDNPVGTHGSTWRRLDSPYPGTRLCVPVFYKELTKVTPCILNIMDALVGVYHGGPLAGKVFHANTITVSQDPLAIDTYLLNLINEHRVKHGYAKITTADGFNEDRHLNASFLRITEERHELGHASQRGLDQYDVSDQRAQYDIPHMDKAQSRVSDVTIDGKHCRLQVHLDGTGRNHKLRSWVEDMDHQIVKELKPIGTRSSYAELQWKPKLSKKRRSEHPRFVWHTEIDDTLHSRMVNI